LAGKTSGKKLLRTLAGEVQTVPPIWLMRQAGRYLPEYRELRTHAAGFLNLCFSPPLASKVTLQPVERFGFDAAILFADILLVPFALGQALRYAENEGPLLQALDGEADLARLDPTRLQERLDPIYKTVSSVRDSLDPETALIGFAGAPWTVASYMIEGRTSKDFTKAKLWALAQPQSFARLIAMLIDATVAYLSRQIEAGAEVVQLFESWAGALGEAELARWSVEPIAEIARRLRAAFPGLPIIAFPRGAGVGYERFAREAGVTALSLDSGVPLAWAAETLAPYCVLQGNLDPVALVAGGEALEQGVLRILEAWKDLPFVFNLGHGVLQTTPLENVTRLVEIVRRQKS
jgi:uroporphyrinogen decarboxylase